MWMQAKEDKKQLQGPGLLLLDRVIPEVSQSEYYVVAEGSALSLKSGSEIESQGAAIARVLFCSRPSRAEIGETYYP